LSEQFIQTQGLAESSSFEYIEVGVRGEKDINDLFAAAIDSMHEGGDTLRIASGNKRGVCVYE